MDLPALLEESIASTGKIVTGVRPEQLDNSTPCTEWDVRVLLNHVIGVANVFSHVGEGTPVHRPDPSADAFSGDGYVGAYDSAAAALLAAWRESGALDATITMPIGDVQGSVAASINFIDILVHGWDLARATGQDPALASHLAEPALQLSRGIMNDQLRASGAFGVEVVVPANAPVGDRLVAFLGRTP